MNKPLLALVFVENGDTLPAEGNNAVIDINGRIKVMEVLKYNLTTDYRDNGGHYYRALLVNSDVDYNENMQCITVAHTI